MKSAMYWHREGDAMLRCDLCPHRCRIVDGSSGRCQIRRGEGGILTAFGYGLLSSAQVDPIEKKPLYHFHPGSRIFSIGGWGCNLACQFCQNWSISQRVGDCPTRYSPEMIIGQARMDGSKAIAYTYNEPLINYEFIMDLCIEAQKHGLHNVLVTNGFINSEPAAELLPHIDALNIDIKSMDEAFYGGYCHASLGPVLDFSRQAVAAGCHVEITNLVIPGLNDSEPLLSALAFWMAEHLGKEVPLHLSAYHPQYKMSVPATAGATMEGARKVCLKHLRHVYIGNVASEKGQDTLCPDCRAVWVQRKGYQVTIKHLKDGRCGKCGRASDIRLGLPSEPAAGNRRTTR